LKNFFIPLNKNSRAFSWINSIPQVAAYAIISKRTFGIDNIKVKCVVFNSKAGVIFNPEEVLDEAIIFYRDNTNGDDPIWSFLRLKI
jgi:hypothetical protein